MSPVKNEQERREEIRRLEQEDLRADARLAEINAELQQIQADKVQRQAKRLRAERPFPPGEICPNCWVNHGEKSLLRAAQHDDPDHYDLLRCSACEYEIERNIRR